MVVRRLELDQSLRKAAELREDDPPLVPYLSLLLGGEVATQVIEERKGFDRAGGVSLHLCARCE